MYKKILFIALASMMLVGCKNNPVTSSEEPKPEYTVTEEFFTKHITNYGFCDIDQNYTINFKIDGQGFGKYEPIIKVDYGKYDVDNSAADFHNIYSFVEEDEDHRYVFNAYEYDFQDEEWEAEADHKTTLQKFSINELSFYGTKFSDLKFDEEKNSYVNIEPVVEITEDFFICKVEYHFEDSKLVYFGYTIFDPSGEYAFVIEGSVTDYYQTVVEIPEL